MPDQNLFELDDSKNRTTIAVNGESNPGLSVFVGAEPNAGNLEVTETGKVDGIVSIEPADKKGPARTQPLRNGRTTFARLEPKTYLVEVSAPGYETTRMSVAVVRGNIAKAPPVSLKLVPTTATFLITGGTADSDVFVDNGSSPIGKLSSNGEFSYQMNPGKHRIQLRKSDFEDSPGVELEFSAGGTTRLGGPDVVLKPYGWIEFNVTPATSRITYRLNSGTNGTVTSKPGETARVRAGRYSISVAANGFQPYTEEAFDVEPGKGKSFSRTLVPASTTSARAAAAPVVMGKDGIEAPQSQVPYSLFRLQLPGTYSFKIRLRRAGLSLGRRARWVVNYIDRNNYIEYEIDDKNLKYTARLKGKEQSKSVQHQVTAGAGDVFDLTVSVSATEVNISSAGQRIPIETPADAGNLILGKFGFPRDESVDMDSFRFTAAPGR
jgi:hypothetical protein